MAEESGVESPPYPGRGTTTKSMYRYLQLLREWVMAEQYALTGLIPEVAEQISAPDDVPPLSVWEGVALPDQFSTYTYVRRIREAWDYTLREHEDSWDGQISFQKRAQIVNLATSMLGNCFVNSEGREMREQAHAAHMRNRIMSMQQMLSSTFTPLGMEQHIEGEIDWDAMFQPKPGETDGS